MRIFIFSLDIVISVDDASNIFHGTHVVVWNPDLIELIKRIRSREECFVKLYTTFAYVEVVLLDWAKIFGH